VRRSSTLLLAMGLVFTACGGSRSLEESVSTTTGMSADTSTEAAPTTSDTAATLPTTTTVTLDLSAGIWARVPHDEGAFGGDNSQLMVSVFALGSRLVAVGSDESGGDVDAAVWVSPDGTSWRRFPHDEAVFGGDNDQGMVAVSAFGSGLVAVGSDESGGDADAAVWTSPDGFNWGRVPHDEAVFGGDNDQGMFSVSTFGSGLVAVGYDGSGNDRDAAVWTSPDGFNWSRVPHDEAVFGGDHWQGMISVVAVGAGLVAVGYDESGGDSDAAAWTSPDGFNWSRVPHDEAVFGGDNNQAMYWAVASDSRLVAVGRDRSGGDADAAVWTSLDGVTWARAPHDEAVFGGSGDQGMWWVVAVGAGLVAVGYDESGGDSDAAVWTSPDGVTWARAPHDEAVFGGDDWQEMWSVAATDTGLVAAGYDWSGGDGDAAVWYWTPD
jgi:hypothetical protein